MADYDGVPSSGLLKEQIPTALELAHTTRGEVLLLFDSISKRIEICPSLGPTHSLGYIWNNYRLDVRSHLAKSASRALERASLLQEVVPKVFDKTTTEEQEKGTFTSFQRDAKSFGATCTDIRTGFDEISHRIKTFPEQVQELQVGQHWRFQFLWVLKGILGSTCDASQRVTAWKNHSLPSLNPTGPPTHRSYPDRHLPLERTAVWIQNDCDKLSDKTLIHFSSLWQTFYLAHEELMSLCDKITQEPDDSEACRDLVEDARHLTDSLVSGLQAYAASLAGPTSPKQT